MLNVWEQTEWRGMARKGTGKKDPFTSRLEWNTQPGQDELKKIPSRRPYSATPLPVTAFSCQDLTTSWRLCTTNGAWDTSHSLSGTTDVLVAVAFSHPDLTELDTAAEHVIFSGGNTPSTTAWAWGFYLVYSSGWKLAFQLRDGAASYKTVVYNTALVSGSTYWCYATWTPTTLYLYVAKDGGAYAAAVTDATLARDTFTGTYYVDVAPATNAMTYFWKGNISFAAINWSGPLTKRWAPDLTSQGNDSTSQISFYPVNPRWSMQPASWPTSTVYYYWQRMPRLSIETASATGLFNAKGVVSFAGKGYTVETPDLELFRQKTVFLFYCQGNTLQDGACLLRSEDSRFSVWLSNAGTLTVYWPPADPSTGNVSYGRLARYVVASVFTAGADEWIAVVVNPTNQVTTDNIEVWRWEDPGAGYSWVQKTGGTGTKQGSGVGTIDTTRWHICHSYSGRCYLYDFRVIVGDTAWATNHTTATITAIVPKELVAWLNLDTSSRFPRVDNVKTYSLVGADDLYPPAIAVSDRVDGTYRFKVDEQFPQHAWSGDTNHTSGTRGTVEDLFIDEVGQPAGTTDAYFFSGTTPKPQYMTLMKGANEVAVVGSHRYIASNAPLSLAAERPAHNGWWSPWVLCYSADTDANLTVDAGGQLEFATTYKVKVTLYDPKTGNESNPHGEFRFTTDSAPGAPPSVYGTLGCSYTLSFVATSYQNLAGQLIRWYRYHAGDGTYYLEGTSPITVTWPASATATWTFISAFVFAMDDDTLTLGKEIEYDNDHPPWSTASYIWNNRAFFVDAFNRSRFFVSKENQLGSVPRANIIWTDEGIGGDILGFLPGFGGLLILRERSIWILPQFATLDNAYAQPLVPDIGCVSGRCAVFAEGVLYWASPHGLHSYDGSQTINHSERLDGMDRKVWDHSPRRTVAYYDRPNWTVVINCDGTGIAIDIRTGSISLRSCPEKCHADISSASYSGPLYGAYGQVWKEDTTGNKSLCLSSAGSVPSLTGWPKLAGSPRCTALWWSWWETAALTSGTAFFGFQTTVASAGKDWLTSTGEVGRTLTWLANDYSDSWTVTLGDQFGDATTQVWHVKTDQTTIGGSDNFQLHQTMLYYEGAHAMLGRMRESRVYDRIDILMGEIVGASTASFALYSMIPNAGTWLNASATTAITSNQFFQLPARIRGNECYYKVGQHSDIDFPNIKAVSVHYRVTQPRGHA